MLIDLKILKSQIATSSLPGTLLLTKSDLAAFRQCPRKLWLEHHQPEAADPTDTTTWRRARDGTIVGEKARERLGPACLWPPHRDDPNVAATQALQLLQTSPQSPAVEVPLVREDLYARADALIPTPSGYILQETKASTFPLKKDKVTPDKPEPHDLDDVAIQRWVFEHSGLPLARVELNLLDNQWRYPGGNDYTGLFRQMDVAQATQPLVAQVPQWLASAKAVLAGPMPDIQTGRQCEKPYPCPFLSHCKPLDAPGPEHPLDLLPGSAGKKLAHKLATAHGYQSLLDPKPDEFTGKDAPLYRRMQNAHRSGNPILEPAAREPLSALPYPRYYFDFEGIDLPVPHWQGVRPYEQIPFQWSCHIESAPGQFEHAEFLDLSGDDPSLPCIEAMLETIPPEGDGPILVYYQTYEKGRLQGFAQRHPEHAAAMQRYIDRLVDLHLIVKRNYYHPAMRGSFSIKKVLPTIAPEMDYDALGEVSDGIAAGVAYLYAVFEPGMSEARREELKKKLLAYCKLDTWAMVEVAWHLQKMGRPAEMVP